MPEQDADATATVTEDGQDNAATTNTETATDSVDEWQAKYDGQLKVNRDLETKFQNATAIARKKLEAEYATKLAAELALKDKPAEEQALEAARSEARAEATAKANERILRADLRAAATGKLADPSDAALYLNLSEFTVTDDGDTDSGALEQAIADLITRKPHLAAQKQNRFDGAADQGAKGKDSSAQQLSRDDLSRMTPEQIEAAEAAGQLRSLKGLKT